MPKAKYKRIVLKFSGEALSGNNGVSLDPGILDRLVAEVGELLSLNVQVAIVIGGGNLFRGQSLAQAGIERITSDHIGMLATLINSLALRDGFERAGYSARIMSAISMSGIVDYYDRRKAIHSLSVGRVVIFAAGTGNPLVTTDSAASLRAIEINADLLLKATQVDGVYDKDPLVHANAFKYNKISYADVLRKELAVMDLSAFTQCRDHNLNLVVYSVTKPGALMRIICGEDEGTLVYMP